MHSTEEFTSGHYNGTGDWAVSAEPGLAWSAEFPVAAARPNDLWVLVCGGIATIAAFAAAFVAAGGLASHAAAAGTTAPAAVTRACTSSPAPWPTPRP